jgi:hypothetical protein
MSIALCAMWVGCGDGGTGELPAPEEVAAEICADPAWFDGERVTMRAPLEPRRLCTAVSCRDAGYDSCCNYCLTTFVVPCGGGTEIQLAEAPGLAGDPVPVTSEVWPPSEPGEVRFGCLGDDCSESCAPAPADRIREVTGVVRHGDVAIQLFVESARVD